MGRVERERKEEEDGKEEGKEKKRNSMKRKGEEGEVV